MTQDNSPSPVYNAHNQIQVQALIQPPMQSTPTPASLKALFVQRRQDFRRNPQSATDLAAYRRRDNTYNYTVVKGLIPPPLVGKKAPGGSSHWQKSDTFFTDFKVHHPDQVLSESDESLVIGNTASHDTRQYLAKWDPDGKDKTPSAGMSYLHLLVIPKKRIYNIVCMDDTAIIDEMLAHFERFWKSPDALDKTTVWLKAAVERRADVVRKSLKSKSPNHLDEFNNLMENVRSSAEELDHKVRQIRSNPVDEIFHFAFHPAPEASIAHLHMHCILDPKEFRQFSTTAHDWKSIPVDIVKEVIRCGEKPVISLWNLLLTVPQGMIASFVHWMRGEMIS